MDNSGFNADQTAPTGLISNGNGSRFDFQDRPALIVAPIDSPVLKGPHGRLATDLIKAAYELMASTTPRVERYVASQGDHWSPDTETVRLRCTDFAVIEITLSITKPK